MSGAGPVCKTDWAPCARFRLWGSASPSPCPEHGEGALGLSTTLFHLCMLGTQLGTPSIPCPAGLGPRGLAPTTSSPCMPRLVPRGLALHLPPPAHQDWVPQAWCHIVPAPFVLGLGPGPQCNPLLALCSGIRHPVGPEIWWWEADATALLLPNFQTHGELHRLGVEPT